MHPPAASPGPAAPAGAELLRWQWREVQAPCLVAAWILVASLAKIGECPRVPTRSGPPGAAVPAPGQAGGMRHSQRARGHPGPAVSPRAETRVMGTNPAGHRARLGCGGRGHPACSVPCQGMMCGDGVKVPLQGKGGGPGWFFMRRMDG